MYHPVETGVSAIIIYSFSVLLYRRGFVSRASHRKFWNIILAFTFVSAALAGIVLAFQITYKWEIPVSRHILRIHAETGIGLAFCGLFHALWHLGYYFRKQDEADQKNSRKEYPVPEIRKLAENLFVTGFISTSAQLLLMRELMNISGGYELVTGIFLAVWLVMSGTGARLARRSEMKDLRTMNLAFIAAPMASVLLLILATRLFFETGETPTVLKAMLLIAATLFPVCFFSGFIFIRLTAIAATKGAYNPGRTFALETAGGIAAGILIPLAAGGRMKTWEMLLVIITMGLSWWLLSFIEAGKTFRLIVKATSTAVCILIVATDTGVVFRQLLMPGTDVISSADTPYGNVTVGVYRGERSIYYNQRLISYSDDAATCEEDIHFAMLNRQDASSVILISGSARSHFGELRKYGVREVSHVETDPELIKLTAETAVNDDKIFRTVVTDGYRYLFRRKEKAGAIILLAPPPSTLLLGRYYSDEFFRQVSGKLEKGGVFLCSPGDASTYYNDESVKLYSAVYSALRRHFANVLPVEGRKLYFLASDDTLSSAFGKLASDKKLENTWVNSYYFQDDLTESRSRELVSLFGQGTPDSGIASHGSVFRFQMLSLSRAGSEKSLVLILLALLFALPAATAKRSSITMYISALALAAFETTLLLTLQIIAGSMYMLSGIIIAGVMAGLAIGSGVSLRLGKLSVTRNTGIVLALFYLASAFVFYLTRNTGGGLVSVLIIILLSLPPGILTGMIYRQLTQQQVTSADPGLIYSSDLSGSAAGFFLAATVAIPLLGISFTLIIITLLVFAVFMLCSKSLIE